MSVQSSNEPLSGLWQPQSYLKSLYYGVGCVEKHLSAALPTSDSKVFVLTGKSIAEKTPLLQRLSSQLGPRLGGSFSGIKQHAQVDGVDEAFELVASNESVDTVISLGGGSPIDAAKTIVFRVHEKSKRILVHIAIPTTLSAAECTAFGGFTNKDGTKVAVGAPWAGASTIFYDAEYAKYTPTRLWTATGLRALDHAVESMYQPYASEMPWRTLSLSAVETLFECLPKSLDAETNTDDNITRLLLAANASLGFKGKAIKGGMGLSHSLGFALGSSYDIPHGETSCITLSKVVRLQAASSESDAKSIARLLPAMDGTPTGDVHKDADEVSNKIDGLVDRLGLKQTLGMHGVAEDQIPIISQRATGSKEGEELFSAVSSLLRQVY